MFKEKIFPCGCYYNYIGFLTELQKCEKHRLLTEKIHKEVISKKK